MIVRAALCALDWNWNVGRAQRVDELGEPQWKEKVNTLFLFVCLFLCKKRTKFKN